jgi:hypothetical protein
MNALASETWAHLELGPELGYGQPDERALMDHHLIELSRQHQERVRVRKFDLAEETVSGADFEWWIVDDNGSLGMRVQAKKLDLSRSAYRQLRHGGDGHSQVDQLIGRAQAHGLLPLYLFFNGPTEGSQTDRCPRHTGEERGCTLARADEVKQVIEHETTSAAEVAAISWPWQCLLCCPAFGSASASERAFRRLEHGQPMPGAVLWTEAPAYVHDLLLAGSSEAEQGATVGEPEAIGEVDAEPLPSAATVLAMRI